MRNEANPIVAALSAVLAVGVAMSVAVAAERVRAADGKPVMTPEEEIQKSNLPAATKAERKLLLHPGDRKTRLEAARAHLAAGADKQANVDAAQTHALAVLAENPQDVESLMLAAQTSLLKNDPQSAVRYYRTVTLVAPDNSAAFLGLGDALTRLRDEPGANVAFARYRSLKGMPPLQAAEAAK
jgi:cytochrome c-type biogenesis protein CcmH/NrfG